MAVADNATCTAVGGCSTATSCCLPLSLAKGDIEATTSLVCLPVYTKVGATVPCASGTGCNTWNAAQVPPIVLTTADTMYAA